MKWPFAIVGSITIALAVPTMVLQRASGEAARCFEALDTRAAPELPDCRRPLPFVARLPFIGRSAVLDLEEMEGRQAAVAYLDASLGFPDEARRAERYRALAPAMQTIEEGSGQLRLDRLGRPLAAPIPELYAAMVDDRVALRAEAERFSRREAQVAALAAAVLEAPLAEASALAARYLDAADPEVRLRAAALRCAAGDAAGMAVALAVERERASERSEGFARAFGSARIVVEACAELVGATAPEVGGHGQAGAWDERARFMAMRLRQLRTLECEPEESCQSALVANLAHVRELLADREQAQRLELVALVADDLEPSEIVAALPPEVVVPRFADELVGRRGDDPFLSPERWRKAAQRLELAGAPARFSDALRAWAAGGFAERGELRAAEAVLAPMHDRVRLAELRLAVALLTGGLEAARERADDLEDDAAGRLLRAELALPDRARALSLVEAAIASPSSDLRVTERARWMRAALEPPTPRRGTIAWVSGTSGTLRQARLEGLLAAFVGARAAEAGERRGFRHRLFWQHRGDAPEGRAAWLFLMGDLVATRDEVEPFLDAIHSVDMRRLTLRQRALARWLAAAWRGHPAAEAWQARLMRLMRLGQDGRRRDLLQTLDL